MVGTALISQLAVCYIHRRIEVTGYIMKSFILHKNPLKVACAFVFSSIGLAVSAQPVVNGVQGDWTRGKNVVIQGSGFGSKGPSVVVFDSFDAGSNGAPINVNADVGTWLDVKNNTYTSKSGYSGSNSVIVVGPGVEGSLTGGKKGSGPHGLDAFQEIFFAVAIKDLGAFPSGTKTSFSDSSSTKDTWLMLGGRGDNASFSGNGHDLYITGHTGNGASKIAGNTTKTSWWVTMKDYWQFGDWNRQTFYGKLNPSNPYGGAEGKFTVINAGGLFVSDYTGSLMTQLSGVDDSWDRVKFGAWYRDTSETFRIMDDMYMATGPGARARVEVCDKPNYSDCTKVGILVPTSWSNSQVSATYYGAPVSPSNAYMYVFDASGNHNSTGYPVNGSSAVAPVQAPPSAPSQIKVVPQ